MNEITLQNRALIALLTAALLALLTGCGYYNPYLAQGSRPISITHSMWSNQTTEIGLENTLFQAQADWFRKSPLITVTDSAATAEYELTGTIDRVTYPEISFGTFREGTEGRAELTVSFTLKERSSGQVVWQKKGATRQEKFYMVQDPIRLQTNRTGALRKIADDFAQEIYLHLITTLMRPSPAPTKHL